jgi:hypothetical protein
MVDIAALAFDDVSEEEKLRHQARIKETGEYLGYKLPQYWVCEHSQLSSSAITLHQHIANGVKDKIEHYNCELSTKGAWNLHVFNLSLVPRDTSRREHPGVLRPFLPEIQRIVEFTHREVLNEVQKSARLSKLVCYHFLTTTNTDYCRWVSSFRKTHSQTYIPSTRPTTPSVRKRICHPVSSLI